MPGPDWRNAADYESLRAADVATLAGEFLQRNPDYQAERERLLRLAAKPSLTQAERDDFALAWGVRFRGRRRVPDMDTAGAAERRRPGHDTRRVSGSVTPR